MLCIIIFEVFFLLFSDCICEQLTLEGTFHFVESGSEKCEDNKVRIQQPVGANMTLMITNTNTNLDCEKDIVVSSLYNTSGILLKTS